MNQQFTNLPAGKKIYLASDFHLGIPSEQESLEREKKIIRWLDSIEEHAEAIILVGDIFDFWFEFKHVIPKGFIRFQGKLAQLRDKGKVVIFFTGNHDLWMFDYFSEALDIPIIRQPTTFQIGTNKVLIGHGDGLGPGDRTFKAIKKIFKSKLAQWGFKWLHPNIGFTLAQAWSKNSRKKGTEEFLGDQEWLLQYCREVEETFHHDYYIFGHRHLSLEMQVNETSTYLNLGEWFKNCTYVEIDSEKATLKTFEN